jgi:uridine phosphorylase
MLPRTTADLLIPILERTSGRKVGVDFGVAVNPEFLREGTCGGYSRDLRLGDLVIATAATPNDGTVSSITQGLPYAPAAHFDVVHAAHHAAESAGRRAFVGPIVSSDLFYDP